MNFFEQQIERLNRRLKHINERPAPDQLQANKLLYELERDAMVIELEEWKKGKPYLYGEVVPLAVLTRALGCGYINSSGEADRVEDATRYFELIRAHGYPDHHCDRTLVGLALVLNGDLPVPALQVATNHACDPIMLASNAIGHHFSVPTFYLDIDSVVERPTEELLAYTLGQVQELIAFAEKHVPGARFDAAKLGELQEMDGIANRYTRELYEFRKKSPCPIGARDVFRLPRPASRSPRPVQYLEYCKAMRDEVAEKAARSIGVLKEEKARVLWTTTAPYFRNAFRILEERGVSLVHFQVGYAVRNFGPKGYVGDTTEYGRKLTPLEEVARLLTFNSWSGRAERWVDDTLYFCKDLNVDAIIDFQQWGCVPALLSSRMLAERAEKELGIPTLSLEGRNLARSSDAERAFDMQLETFVEGRVLPSAKRRRA